ncbi:MAG: SDR family NAD(P)-dependent oxidoreductase [Deltaproteobacteria bacterium]|nr:SDR family NAD(P)-dependent oxidoreductase [Deltaproteobacteria bacterium]
MKEQVVLITGVSRGFGLELTREYCQLGWRVFGVLRSKEGAARIFIRIWRGFHSYCSRSL